MGAISFNAAAQKALAILIAGAFGSVLTTMVCLALGINNGLDPADVPAVRDLFPSLQIRYFLPEPLERAQVISFMIGAYIASIGLVLFPRIERMVSTKTAAPFWFLLSIGCSIVLVFGDDAFQIPVRLYATLKSVWLPEKPALWLALFLVASAPVFAKSWRFRCRVEHILGAISILGVLVLCARVTFLEPPKGLTLDISNHHNSAALHSVVQSAFGHVPYLDFVPQYGGYGLFALPFFRLGLEPWAALCLFIFCCYVVTFGAMGAAVGFAAKSWVAGAYAGIIAFWLSSDFRTALSYFQGFPVRTLFPSIFLLLVSVYPLYPRLISIISGFMVPVAIFWNPETGIVCLAATASLLVFDAAMHRHLSPAARVWLTPALLFLLTFFIASAAFYAGTLLILDHAIPLGELLLHGIVFSSFGYFNLPMPPLDLWVPAAGAFCLLLSSPVPYAADRGRILFGFFCAMLFAGLFFYYQGRSYTGNLVGLSFPIVCGLIAWLWPNANDRLLNCELTKRNLVVLAFAVASAALSGSSFISAAFLNPLLARTVSDDQALRDFIRKESGNLQTAFILSPQAWRLHLLSSIAPPKMVPPQSGLLSRAQEETTIRALDPKAGYLLFVDPTYFSRKVATPGNRFHKILIERIDSEWQRQNSLKLPTGELTVYKPRARP